jgi:ornithine carbamoyltransferase
MPMQQQRFSRIEDLSASDVQALLAHARAAPGAAVLRGRHVAVVSDTAASESADALAAAALALGATVVRLHPGKLRLEDRAGLRATALLLGRLYALIGVEGLDARAARTLGRWAGVPVLDGVAAPCHPSRLLADLLAMQEHAGRPPAEITLELAGDAAPASARAWRRLSGLTGLRIGGGPRDVAPGNGAFVFRPDAGAGLRLIAADGRVGDGDADALARRRLDAHRRVLSSLLVQLSG